MKNTSKKQKVKPSTEAATAARIQGRLDREAAGIFPAVFMRLTLTEDAYNITKDMKGAEFREFASAAVLHLAKKRHMV